jgi:hypothetical protein
MRRKSVVGLLLAVTAGAWPAAAPGVAAASATAGAAVITEASQDVPLDRGGSATLFGVWLPDHASCSGDTEHKGYHTFTFMFPKDLSPASVSFKTGEPAGFGADGRLGLFADGQYVGALNTAPDTGQVVGLPGAYSWTRLTPAYLLLTNGRTTSAWDAGIVCANKYGDVTNYWDIAVVFTASKTDPLGFTWSVPKSAQSAISDPHSFPVGVVLVTIAAVLALVALVLNRRRKAAGHHVGR